MKITTEKLGKNGKTTIRLYLRTGNILEIIACDQRAYSLVSHLKKTMQLTQVLSESEVSEKKSVRRLLIHGHKKTLPDEGMSDQLINHSDVPAESIKARNPLKTPVMNVNSRNGDTVIDIFGPTGNDDERVVRLLYLSLVICRHAQSSGGVLLHGALAGWNGYGVILAGRGGVGKSTASQRFPESWRSLSDDATLIVRDEKGLYWAHPWPTWSTFLSGGTGGSWDVQNAVPLRGIFFLRQGQEDTVEPIGAGETICWLVESAEQISMPMAHISEGDELRALRLERFDNICALAKAVPGYRLHMSLSGTFWQEIEQILSGNYKG